MQASSAGSGPPPGRPALRLVSTDGELYNADGEPAADEAARAEQSKPADEPGYDALVTITVREVVDAFLTERRLMGQSGACKPKTLERYESRLASFVEMFGDLKIKECRQQHMVKWLAAHPEWKSSHTKSDSAGAVVTCFRWAQQENVTGPSPFRKPKGLWPALLPRVAIRPDEYDSIMLAAKRRGYRSSRIAFRRALFFLWETGARTCEMREVVWTDIDWETGMVSLAVHKTLASTGEARLIAMSGVLIRYLRLLNRKRPKDDHVFLNGRGTPWQPERFASLFKKAATAAAVRLNLSPYCLRHGFTVSALERGVGERQVADLLGHTTTRYISWYGRSTRRHADYLRGTLDQVHGRKKRPKGK